MTITISTNNKRQQNQTEGRSSELDVKEISKEISKEINIEAEKLFGNDPQNFKAKREWALSELTKRVAEKTGSLATEKLNILEATHAELSKKEETLKKALEEKKSEGLNKILDIPIEKLSPELSKLPQVIMSQIQKTLNPSQAIESSKSADTSKKEGIQEETNKAETKIVSVLESKNLGYSMKAPNGSYRSENYDISLKSDGSLKVLNKSQQDVSTSFTTVYIGSDNILRDQKGNKIDYIQSATGNLIASFVPNLFDKTRSQGSILQVHDRYLNNFSIDGKQIVFVKGSPEQTQKTTKTVDIDQAEKSQTVQKQTPWTKYNYIENINGQYIEKSAYVRVNTNKSTPNLEIFMGKDYQGNDIWVNANSVSHPKLSLVTVSKETGAMTTANGREIHNFSSMSGSHTDAKSVLKSFNTDNQDQSKAIGLRKDYFNDLLIDGRRPVFFKL